MTSPVAKRSPSRGAPAVTLSPPRFLRYNDTSRLLVERLDSVVTARAEREREHECKPATFHESRS